MAGFLGLFKDQNDPNSSENVSTAFRLLNDKLKRDEGNADEDWWKNRFAELERQGKSPAAALTENSDTPFPEEPTPLERWKSQVHAMVSSGNETLQKKGLDLLGSTKPPAPGASTTVNVGDDYFKSSDYVVDKDKNPVNPPVWMKKGDAPEDWTWGHKPTAEEAGKIAATQAALDNLVRLRDVMATGNTDVTGIEGWISSARSGKALPSALLNAALDLVGKPITDEGMQALSLSMMISNQITYAFRGAQVSAAEQDKMDRQLPIPGQPEGLFVANMANSYRTLVNQQRKTAESRGLPMPTAVEDFMDFTHPKSGNKYRIMPDGTFQKWVED